jgi:hypothetical protein
MYEDIIGENKKTWKDWKCPECEKDAKAIFGGEIGGYNSIPGPIEIQKVYCQSCGGIYETFYKDDELISYTVLSEEEMETELEKLGIILEASK